MSIHANGDKTPEVLEMTMEGRIPFSMGEFGMSAMLNLHADLMQPALATSSVARRVEVANAKAGAFVAKRVLDIAVAGTLLLLLAPVFLAVALAVKFTSKGPVFFTQRRWGKGNAAFRLYKFRSMYADRQDVSGVMHTVKNDPRVTPFGHFIRRTSLDELPQLINVLKGDMSLVGPRAHVLGMHAAGVRYEDLVPEYFARHTVRPGITGLAQIRGLRGEVSDATHAQARVDADLEYIRAFSIWMDVKILALTLPAVIIGRAAI